MGPEEVITRRQAVQALAAMWGSSLLPSLASAYPDSVSEQAGLILPPPRPGSDFYNPVPILSSKRCEERLRAAIEGSELFKSCLARLQQEYGGLLDFVFHTKIQWLDHLERDGFKDLTETIARAIDSERFFPDSRLSFSINGDGQVFITIGSRWIASNPSGANALMLEMRAGLDGSIGSLWFDPRTAALHLSDFGRYIPPTPLRDGPRSPSAIFVGGGEPDPFQLLVEKDAFEPDVPALRRDPGLRLLRRVFRRLPLIDCEERRYPGATLHMQAERAALISRRLVSGGCEPEDQAIRHTAGLVEQLRAAYAPFQLWQGRSVMLAAHNQLKNEWGEGVWAGGASSPHAPDARFVFGRPEVIAAIEGQARQVELLRGELSSADALCQRLRAILPCGTLPGTLPDCREQFKAALGIPEEAQIDISVQPLQFHDRSCYTLEQRDLLASEQWHSVVVRSQEGSLLAHLALEMKDRHHCSAVKIIELCQDLLPGHYANRAFLDCIANGPYEPGAVFGF